MAYSILNCCHNSSNNKGNAPVRVNEQGFYVQALLVLVHIVSEDEVTLLVDRSVSFVAGCVVVVILIISMASL